MKVPLIKTSLPGPKASEFIRTDAEFVSPSYTRVYPLVVEKARGLWVQDVDGNRFLDFTAGIAVNSTGHCHPEVVKAIRDQAGKLIHMSGADFYYSPQIVLAEKLAEIANMTGGARVFFGNSGAEAVEASFKLARYHTRREQMIAFFGAFHGRTMGALSLTASKAYQKKYYHPFVPGITHVPYPNCYHCPHGACYPTCGSACVRWIEDPLFRTCIPPEEVAAIFVEPIQGEGGYIVPPPEFHVELSKLAKKYGILLVADEIQSGMGRTGKMFAMEHFGVEPDIMALAKGIASGMPLGAMIANCGTYGLACRIARIDFRRQPRFLPGGPGDHRSSPKRSDRKCRNQGAAANGGVEGNAEGLRVHGRRAWKGTDGGCGTRERPHHQRERPRFARSHRSERIPQWFALARLR